jgi:hypothetical protein
MLRSFTLIALSASFPLLAGAQGLLTLTDEDNADVTNGSVTMNIAADMNEYIVHLTATLNGSVNRSVNVKRYEVAYGEGSMNYFCWNECYGAEMGGDVPFWVAPDAQGLQAGTPFTGFGSYYQPTGSNADAHYRFVWYAVSDPNDSVYVDIFYDVAPVGIRENTSLVRSFEAFPNPSANGNVTLSYDLQQAPVGTRLVVYNMLGERALTRTIGAAQGRVVLGTGELSAGVWFAALESNGRAIATKRLVIAR